MSFLYPLFLAALAAIAVPLVLHLFRRKTEAVVDFPAVRLLHSAPVEQQRRRRLREWILLALRVAALALLAFAFARPYLASSEAVAPVPVTVIALDTSLSMSAPGQWARAQQAAKDAVRAAPATHSVALVTFDDNARSLVAPTTDRGGVSAAIDEAAPGGGGTRYRTALARAAEAIASGQGQIVVVTDLQQAGWEASDEGSVPDGIDVQVREIAGPAANLAVTTARRDGAVVIAGIHNFGGRTVRATARLRAGDREFAARPVDVAPQAAADVRFEVALPSQGGAVIQIDDAEGYAGDNSRYLVLDPALPLPILILTARPPDASNAGLYVERALAVAADGGAFAPRVVEGRAFGGLSAAEVTNAAGLVLLGTSTMDRAGRERIAAYVRGGGRVLVALGPDIDTATLADTVGASLEVQATEEAAGRTVALVATDTRHPVFRPFSTPGGALGDVYVDRYRRLNLQGQGNVLARFTGAGDALLEVPVERGRLLVFASDLDNAWNRFPLNPAFVPWMIETAHYLAAGRDERQNYTLPDVPAGVPARPGVHQSGARRVAVNPNVREANPTRTTPNEFLAAVTRSPEVAGVHAAAAAREQEDRQRLWQIGLVLMFLALASEGLIGRKAV